MAEIESDHSELTELEDTEPASSPVETTSISDPSSITLSSDSLPSPSAQIPIQLPSVRKMPKPLPARGAKSAPSFDGKAGHLKRYFQDVEDVGTDSERTTDGDLIHIALRYLEIDEEQLWTRKQTAGMTFQAFKSAIVKLYPGADGDKLYTWTDFREVVRTAQLKSPANRDEFGQYTRDFQRIADFLKAKGKISDREVNEYFMKGIHPDFRLRVLGRLQVVRSAQPSDEPYPMVDVIEAAEWAINGVPGALYKESDEDSTYIKKEMVELTTAMRDMNQTFTAQIQSLSRKIETGPPRTNDPPRNRAPAYQNQVQTAPGWNREAAPPLPAQNQAYQDAQRTGPGNNPGGGFPQGKCGGCGEAGHYLRECPKIEEYIRSGKCRKNEENRIVLPGGNYIPRYITGNSFVERIDKWHAQQQTPAQVNLYTRDSPPHMLYMATSSNAEEVDEREATETLAYQVGEISINELENEDIEAFLETRKRTERAKPKEVFDGVLLPPKPPPAPKKKVAFTPDTVPPPQPKSVPKSSVVIRPAAVLEEPTFSINPSKPFIQRYRAPIEDFINTGEMVNRAMATKFEITPQEFFAIFPEGRKYMKDLLTAKKVPTVGVTYSEAARETQYVLRYEEKGGEVREDKLTSSEIDALRVVDPVLDDTLQVEAVLDQGSEIIAMNKDLWLKLGVGLDPQKILNMQSANSQSNATAGVISDYKITIGGLDLRFQVHVVQGAPFDLLLGRPFFRFTGCVTTDDTDGSQQITLTCPNTGKRVTIPTRKKTNKSRNPFRQEIPADLGFQGAGQSQ